MNNKYGTVRNPLTIIAIFSGIAEVSGTAVLPFLQNENQTLYVWFLMIFPLTIVILFFMTLNWNYKVLYAPSDFQNEDNFVNLLQKATTSELIIKESNEAVDLSETVQESTIIEQSETGISGDAQIQLGEINVISTATTSSPPTLNDLIEKLGLADDEIATKEIRAARSQVMQKIQRNTIREGRLAEKLAIEKLEKDLGVNIETDVKINPNRSSYIFDGIIRQNNKLTAVEVKFFRDPNANSFGLMRTVDQLRDLYTNLSDAQKNDFSLIFVLVTDNMNDEVIAKLSSRMQILPFPVAVKCYEFDQLVSELIRKVA